MSLVAGNPDVSQSFLNGIQVGASSYARTVARQQADADAETARQQSIDDRDEAERQEFAKIALTHQLKAAETKAQTKLQFNQSYWESGVAAASAPLDEAKKNIELWLNPTNRNKLTETAIKSGEDTLAEINQRKYKIAQAQPRDFEDFQDPALHPDLFSPLANKFTPEWSDTYKAKLEKESAPKGSDDKWYAHHAITRAEHLSDQQAKDLAKRTTGFTNAQNKFSDAYGQLRNVIPPAGISDAALIDKETQKKIDAANKAASNFSDEITNLSTIDPKFSAISEMWNKNKPNYNGLATYSDIDRFLNDQVAKAGKLASKDNPEFKVTAALQKLVYGGGSTAAAPAAPETDQAGSEEDDE